MFETYSHKIHQNLPIYVPTPDELQEWVPLAWQHGFVAEPAIHGEARWRFVKRYHPDGTPAGLPKIKVTADESGNVKFFQVSELIVESSAIFIGPLPPEVLAWANE